jgi:hypothetical protein
MSSKKTRMNGIEGVEICISRGFEKRKVHCKYKKASPKNCNDLHECGKQSLEYKLPSCELGDNHRKDQVW